MRRALVALAPSLGLALAACTSSPLRIQLAHGSDEERRTERQLERLIATFDLSRWIFTDTVAIDEESIPHSHPVLTLHTRHLRDDLLLLSTFIHEQSHWHFEMNQTTTSSAIRDLEALFPDLPVGFPEGASTHRGSYEHLMVNLFEQAGLRSTAGELAARQAMEFWATDHYRALYRLVLAEPAKIRGIIEAHHLDGPIARR
jgi:hypothetical protein